MAARDLYPFYRLCNMASRLSAALILAFILAAYLLTATSRAILDDGDALYAHVAQQMIERDDWVTPYANGVRFLDKPPMMYWLMAGSYGVFGANGFAARFPSVLAVAGTALLLFLMLRNSGDAFAGSCAAAASAFSMGTFLFTRMVFPDAIFVFFLTLALYAFLEWHDGGNRSWRRAALFYGALAAAALTKGLIGVVFPVVIVSVLLFLERDPHRFRNLHLWKGAALAALLCAPWFVLAARRNDGFLWYHIVNEQFLRFLGRRQPDDYESIALPVFLGLIPVWFFPWTAFLPAVPPLVRMRHALDPRKRAAVRLGLTWSLFVLLFFSVSSRIEHYALPVIPALALLVGVALAPGERDALSGARERAVGRGFLGLAVVGAALLALAGFAAFGSLLAAFSGEGLAGRLHGYRHYFAPVFELPAETRARLLLPLLAALASLAAGLIGAWWLNRRRRRGSGVFLLSGTMAAFFACAFYSLGVCEPLLTSRHFGQTLTQHCRSGDRLIVVGDYETANSLNFYTRLAVEVCDGTAAVLEWGLKYPDAPKRILSVQDLHDAWQGPGRVFVLVPDSRTELLNLPGASILMRSQGRTLLCNRPAGLPPGASG